MYNGALSSITRVLTMRILEEALTFDDVLLVPAHSDFLPRDADLIMAKYHQSVVEANRR